MVGSALLALEDGSLFYGRTIGSQGQSVGEVVFNTALTGYQEILTDPSYCRQIVTLTQPQIGNVGTNEEDEESARVFVAGLVIRELSPLVSNWRATESLPAYLRRHNVVAIADIDTRRLTRLLRDKGAQRGCITVGEDIDPDVAVAAAKAFPGLQGMDLAKVVTSREAYGWDQGIWSLDEGPVSVTGSGIRRWRVAAYDFGIKHNILRILTAIGCDVTVLPATTAAGDVLALQPDGVFLSNGPGDPEPCTYAIQAITELLATGIPMFGICLGHQLLALAMGAGTVKMKFGHHGANHPVQELGSGRVFITSQNHGFAVTETGLPAAMEITHRSLFDGTIQGIRHHELPAYGFQGHPEASPGPHDIQPLFHRFIELMAQVSG